MRGPSASAADQQLGDHRYKGIAPVREISAVILKVRKLSGTCECNHEVGHFNGGWQRHAWRGKVQPEDPSAMPIRMKGATFEAENAAIFKVD